MSKMMDCGLVKFGKNATKVSTDTIRKLKSILDQHHIYHIVDGVTFFHPRVEMARSGKTQRDWFEKTHTTEGRSHEDNIDRGDGSSCGELIVPGLYELDYMSLIFLNSEEAEFLASIVYDR